jgi:Domain of unknown function (DUF4112)
MRHQRTSVDQRVNALRESPLTSPSVARNLERVAWLMDRAIKIPGTKITIGLDALLGLFPVGGDLLTGVVQAAVVLVALYHYRVPKVIAIRMMGNVLLDVAVGAFPVLGDLFDVAFKANTRNLALLDPYRREIEPGDATIAFGDAHKLSRDVGMPWRYLAAIGATLLAALILVFIGLVTVVRWFLK